MATRRDASKVDKEPIVHEVEVVHHGEKLVVPESMGWRDVIDHAKQQLQHDEETVAINATIDCFVFDGAYALNRVLADKFGWVRNVPTPGFWGDEPPTMLGVRVGLNETIQVPWGRIRLPGVEGFIETSVAKKDGRFIFRIGGEVKRKHEKQLTQIVDAVRKFVRENSLYKGKAIEIKFHDEHGDVIRMPEPEFLDLTAVKETELIFSDTVATQIKTSIFTPIENTEALRKFGIPLKRGVLLAGPFGTGKTLTSAVTATKAVRHGWTFLVCKRADELADTLRLAQQFQPAVVFCEDVDEVMGGERDEEVNNILNILDGVGSKSSEIMVVLTTNNHEKITQAMMRPGRIDDMIYVTPPDAKAVEKLIRLFGRGLITENEDLTAASNALEGQIPAVVREIVERSKLFAIGLHEPGTVPETLDVTEPALLGAVEGMRVQISLLQPRTEDTRSERVKAAQISSDALMATTKALVTAFARSLAFRTDGFEHNNLEDELSSGYDLKALGMATAATGG